MVCILESDFVGSIVFVLGAGSFVWGQRFLIFRVDCCCVS